jgi:phospholipid/cholesterol/gamma-HCH transport system ATP-binding protein
METVTAVRNVRKSFGDQAVLNGVSFELSEKQVTCILGRSGTGKSVLLKILMGLERADSGQVLLHGSDITDGAQPGLNEARKKTGFLFQQAALYDSMSVADNVAFPLRRHLKLPEAEIAERVQALLESVGLQAHDYGKMPSEISGGMKKRVGLARALALEPAVVLFDEPTAGLDPISAAEIAALIVELRDQRGITCLVVTHDLPTARKIANRLIALDRCLVVFDGSTEEFERSADPFIRQYLKDAA